MVVPVRPQGTPALRQLLLAPLQRLPRYRLLVNELIKATPTEGSTGVCTREAAGLSNLLDCFTGLLLGIEAG